MKLIALAAVITLFVWALASGFIATRKKWLRACLGSGIAWLVACVLGFSVAIAYERVNYLPEPDPVHFDVAMVWLAVWGILWILGTIAVGYWVFRKSGPQS